MNLAKIPRYPVTIDQETIQIGTAAELAVALDVLQGQYDRVVLTQLRPHLSGIILNARDLSLVMKSLAVDDQLYLIEALGQNLTGILQEARSLRDLLAATADTNVEEALLSTLGRNGLRSLVLTAAELAEVLEWVYGQCDELALDLIGLDHLRDLCRTAGDLGDILCSLEDTLQESLIEQLGWEFTTSLVRNGRDLACLLRALPPAGSERLLLHFTPAQLRQRIGNARDWAYLYQRLEPAEAEYLTQRLDLQQPGRNAHA